MHKLRLVPLGSESVEERVAAFRQYNDEVRNKIRTLGEQMLVNDLLYVSVTVYLSGKALLYSGNTVA